MKDMELYVIESAKERETSERRRHRQRVELHQQREAQYGTDKTHDRITIVCFALILIAIFVSIAKEEPAPERESEKLAAKVTETGLTPVEMPELNGNEEIEAALAEMGCWRSDVPLDFEIQIDLRAACEINDLPFRLVLAQMWQETHYENRIGDGGDSIGYMQVQTKWNHDRMKRLGVTDLSDPESNFRVVCDYLRECIDTTNTTASALTKYNSGKPGKNQYAVEVLEKWEQLGGEEHGGC